MNKKCQVFTPQDYVNALLDSIGYTHNLYGKKIMENSCGDGNILAAVVQRYIDDCKREGFTRTKIRNGLAKDVYGVEIDPKQHSRCIEKLNEIVACNNLLPVNWNIFNADYLKMHDCISFDYVVGNPPYITYKEISKKDQSFLKQTFASCKNGKFDYCYAFLEKSIHSLSHKGKLSYLIPSSIFKTVFGNNLRKLMLPYTISIIDYTQEKLFSEALVKSAIIVLDMTTNASDIHYVDEASAIDRWLSRDDLGDKWNFLETNAGKRRFGDYFKVSHSIATLCNKAYIIKEWEINSKGNYIIEGIEVEKEVVRIATSPKLMHTKKSEIILFPYRYDSKHNLIHYSEHEFEECCPGAFKYLRTHKTDLDKRDSDSASLWFEYGRSQALSYMEQEKALISTILSSEVLVYKLDKNCVPYAGMYIVAKNKGLSIDDGINILLKDEFYRYALSIGIHINGNSVRITSKDIEEYRF